MSRVKKLLIFAFCLIFAFSFVGCGGAQNDGTDNEVAVPTTPEIEEDISTDNEENVDDASIDEDISSSGGITYEDIVNAAEIVAKMLNRPDPWSFFPTSLYPEALAYEDEQISDWSTDFVSVSSISQKMIGQQLGVMYSGLNTVESVLTAANIVFTAGDAIGEVYQAYINENPTEYTSFSGSTTVAGVGLSFKIDVDGNYYSLLAKCGVIYIELSTDGVTDTGRISVTNGATIKYENTGDTLRIAVQFSATILGVTGLFTQEMHFARDLESGAITGYLYEYAGTDSGVGTCLAKAYYYSDSSYTAILSNCKDESSGILDSTLSIDAYMELYDTQSGKLLGCEVTESALTASYDTYWFNLYDVTGINTIKVTDEENSNNTKNNHSIYVNGSSTCFTVAWNSILTVKTSRKYDIEMKTVDYVIASYDEDGNISYEICEYQVPMLFVQANVLSTYSSLVTSNNSSITSSQLPSYTAISAYFTTLEPYYQLLGDSVTYATIVAYIGEKNSYFD